MSTVAEKPKTDFMKNVITTEIQMAWLIKQLQNHQYIVFDLETTGFSFLTEEIVGIGVGTVNDDLDKITTAVYIPVEYHNGIEDLLPPGTSTHLNRKTVFDQLRPFFLDFGKWIIAHNLKFDMQFMINEGIDLRPKLALPEWRVPAFLSKDGWKSYLDNLAKTATCIDTMVMSWLLNENKPKHGLKNLAKEELNLDMAKLDKILGKKFKFHEAPAIQTLPYALMDIIGTAKLFINYMKKIKEEKLYELLIRVEMPFVGVLQGIERRGMPVNRNVLETIGERCEREMASLQEEIFKAAGKVFNINASAQLATIIHEELGLPVVAKTPKGAIKTDAATLQQLLDLGEQHKDQLKERHFRGLKIIDLVLKFRKIKKVFGTYVEGILEKIDIDGRLHAGFHQTGTVTGRLSSSGPNLQNLPSGAIFKDHITVEEYYAEITHIIAEYPDPTEREIEIQKHFMFTVVPVAQEKPGKYVPCDEADAEMFEIQWKIRDAFQDSIKDWWLVVGDLANTKPRSL